VRKIIFLFILIQSLFVWSAIQRWRWQRKGIWSSILKRYTGATREISLQKRLYAPQKCGIWKHSLQHFTKPKTQCKTATIASYRVSHVLAKHKKPFKDGEIVKEAFLEAVDSLFGNFKNKTEIVKAIKEVQLYRNMTTRWCEGMAVDVEEQLRKDIVVLLMLSMLSLFYFIILLNRFVP